MDHPHESMFEQFVIGALTPDESRTFLAHVSECDVCSKTLETEAQAELAVLEVHAAAPSRVAAPKRLAPRRRWPVAALGALALAAAILLLLRGRSSESGSGPGQTMIVTAPRGATSAIPLVTCPDGLDQEKCVEDAHRHGLFVSYPPWAHAPRLGGGRPGQGPSGSPFSGQQM